MPRENAVTSFPNLEAVPEFTAIFADHVELEVVADGLRAPVPGEFREWVVKLMAATAGGHRVTIITDAEDLTPQEAADILDVSRATVLRLVDAGDLPSTTVPGSTHRRLPREAVEAFAAERGAFVEAMNTGFETERAAELAPHSRRRTRGRARSRG